MQKNRKSMSTPSSPTPPFGVGNATCDPKWRVRLPVSYSSFLLGSPPTDSNSLIVATLDRRDILIWRKVDFLRWQQWLLRPANAEPARVRELLRVAQIHGGEAEIDDQGRLVLPRATREALGLTEPPADGFRILFEFGVVRLVRPDTLFSPEFTEISKTTLDSFAIEHYGQFLSNESNQ